MTRFYENFLRVKVFWNFAWHGHFIFSRYRCIPPFQLFAYWIFTCLDFNFISKFYYISYLILYTIYSILLWRATTSPIITARILIKPKENAIFRFCFFSKIHVFSFCPALSELTSKLTTIKIVLYGVHHEDSHPRRIFY